MGSLFKSGGGGGGNIHEAARTGDMTKLKEILAKSPERINEKDSLGQTPLHLAMDAGKTEAIKFLVNKGADMNARDNDKRTPLYYIEMRPNEELEEFLREKGAKI